MPERFSAFHRARLFFMPLKKCGQKKRQGSGLSAAPETGKAASAKEPLLHSICCAGVSFFALPRQKALFTAPLFLRFPSLQGKNPFVIAIIPFNRGSFVFIVQ